MLQAAGLCAEMLVMCVSKLTSQYSVLMHNTFIKIILLKHNFKY